MTDEEALDAEVAEDTAVPPAPKKKKSVKKKKSKKAVTEGDDEEDAHEVKPKKKKSKKIVDDTEDGDEESPKPKKKKIKKHTDDEEEPEEVSEDEEAPKKKKSMKKKKSTAQVTIEEEETEKSPTTLTRQSGYDRRQSSMLAASDDPFALREGKTLLWRNVNMTLVSVGKIDSRAWLCFAHSIIIHLIVKQFFCNEQKSKDGVDRKLLDDVWGEVPEQQTTAIMGPSGAGKTSLLNILAGRAKTRGKITITSDVRLNNFSVDPTSIHVRKNIAFVAQDDSLQVTSTPREAIYFSAKLRLPRTTPEKNLQKLVKRMLQELGLEACADTYVGGALLKGISGGERKRCSVGVELVVRPAMVFLDEPTSGLDSFSAIQLCQVLKKVANAGSSVLFTIHQPSSEIFNAFDRLILMNKGRVMFQGLVTDVPSYFAVHNQPLPKNYNPADWIMNVAQANTIKQLDQDGFFPKDNRELPEPFVKAIDGKDELGITLTDHHLSGDFDDRPPHIGVQIGMLFTREIRNIKRDTAAVGARFGLTAFLGLLIGLIFKDVGEQDPLVPSNLNSIFGALIMVLLMSMFGTAQPALLAFPEERPVFLREYSTNHYSVIAYFLARFTMEAVVTALQVLLQLLITYFLIGFQSGFGMLWLTVYALAMSSTALSVLLGCAVEDPKLGQEMLPLLFVPQMLFAGFFVRPELIPVWLR
jgi:ABC-type multidrug transport system ATPase subunit